MGLFFRLFLMMVTGGLLQEPLQSHRFLCPQKPSVGGTQGIWSVCHSAIHEDPEEGGGVHQ